MVEYYGVDLSNATSGQITGLEHVYYDEKEFARHGAEFMVDLIIKRAMIEQESNPELPIWVTFWHDEYDTDLDWETYTELLSMPILGYQPRAISHSVEEEGFSVEVEDMSGWKPTVWIDVYRFNDDTYPVIDWNMWIFHKFNAYEQEVKRFQEEALTNDGDMWHSIEEEVLTYLVQHELIECTEDGYKRVE